MSPREIRLSKFAMEQTAKCDFCMFMRNVYYGLAIIITDELKKAAPIVSIKI